MRGSGWEKVPRDVVVIAHTRNILNLCAIYRGTNVWLGARSRGARAPKAHPPLATLLECGSSAYGSYGLDSGIKPELHMWTKDRFHNTVQACYSVFGDKIYCITISCF